MSIDYDINAHNIVVLLINTLGDQIMTQTEKTIQVDDDDQILW